MSMEAAVAAVLSALDSICTVKGEQKTAPRALLGGQDCLLSSQLDLPSWCTAASQRAVKCG